VIGARSRLDRGLVGHCRHDARTDEYRQESAEVLLHNRYSYGSAPRSNVSRSQDPPIGVGPFLLSRAIRMGGLSTAYTLGLGVEAIVSVAIGTYLFEERLSPVKLLGVVLIIAGATGVRFG
jgi:hypothetical protein